MIAGPAVPLHPAAGAGCSVGVFARSDVLGEVSPTEKVADFICLMVFMLHMYCTVPYVARLGLRQWKRGEGFFIATGSPRVRPKVVETRCVLLYRFLV